MATSTERYRRWRKKNLKRARAIQKAYRLRTRYKDRATQQRHRRPAWADTEAIETFYALAALMTEITGVPYQVDHIVPICSKWVCGLHTEHNLQVITGLENQRKLNLRWPGMPETLTTTPPTNETQGMSNDEDIRKATLARIAQGLISRSEAASLLGVTERTVNRWMAAEGVKRPDGINKQARERAHADRIFKRQVSLQVMKGQLSLSRAAELAKCSERTIYRCIERIEAMLEAQEKQDV